MHITLLYALKCTLFYRYTYAQCYSAVPILYVQLHMCIVLQLHIHRKIYIENYIEMQWPSRTKHGRHDYILHKLFKL